MKLQISVVQMKSKLGEIDANLEQIVNKMQEAAECGSELIIFPEMSLSGYSLTRAQMDIEFGSRIQWAIDEIRQAGSRYGVDTVVSFPEISEDKVHITAAYIERGRVLSQHRKVYLADYLHAVEHLHFDPGRDFRVFDTRHGRVGLLICEDVWHLSSAIILGQQQPDIIIAPSATSITTLNNLCEIQMRWEILSRAIAMTQAAYFIYCNQSGTEDQLIFWGGSHMVSPYGEIIARLPRLEADTGSWMIDTDYIVSCKQSLPLAEKEKNAVNIRHFNRFAETKEAE